MRVRAALALLVVALLSVSQRGTAVAQTALHGGRCEYGREVAAIQDCIDRVGNHRLGLPELELRCPDLQAALQAAGLRPLIIDSSRAVSTAIPCAAVPTLIHPAAGPAPPVAALGPILRELHAPRAPPQSWWRAAPGVVERALAPQQEIRFRAPWLDVCRGCCPDCNGYGPLSSGARSLRCRLP